MAISVEESAELRYKHRYFSRIGRRVYYLAIGKINYINIVMGSKSTFFFRQVEGFIGYELMYI